MPQPAAVEGAGSGDRPALCGSARAERLAHPEQEFVAGREVPALRVDGEVGGAVALDASPRRASIDRVRSSALSKICTPLSARHSTRPERGVRPSARGARSRASVPVRFRARPRGHSSARGPVTDGADPRGADVEHHPAGSPSASMPRTWPDRRASARRGGTSTSRVDRAAESVDFEPPQVDAALVPHDLAAVARDGTRRSCPRTPPGARAPQIREPSTSTAPSKRAVAAHAQAGADRVRPGRRGRPAPLTWNWPRRGAISSAPAVGDVGALRPQVAGADARPRGPSTASSISVVGGSGGLPREADVAGAEGQRPASAARALPELALESGQVEVQRDALVVDLHLAPRDQQPADAHLEPTGPPVWMWGRSSPPLAEARSHGSGAIDLEQGEQRPALPRGAQGGPGHDAGHLEEGRRVRRAAPAAHVQDLGREGEEVIAHLAHASPAGPKTRTAGRRWAPRTRGRQAEEGRGEAGPRRRRRGQQTTSVRRERRFKGASQDAAAHPTTTRRTPGLHRSARSPRAPPPPGLCAGSAARSPSSWPPSPRGPGPRLDRPGPAPPARARCARHGALEPGRTLGSADGGGGGARLLRRGPRTNGRRRRSPGSPPDRGSRPTVAAAGPRAS